MALTHVNIPKTTAINWRLTGLLIKKFCFHHQAVMQSVPPKLPTFQTLLAPSKQFFEVSFFRLVYFHLLYWCMA
jgi:hypothetical protein